MGGRQFSCYFIYFSLLYLTRGNTKSPDQFTFYLTRRSMFYIIRTHSTMNLNDFLLLLSLLALTVPVINTQKERRYYRAAILEHVRFGDYSHTKNEILEANLKTYEIAAETAAQNGADIIVFPECGIYPPNKENRSWVKNFAEDVPDPKEELSNPCSQSDRFEDRPILKQLSCLAYRNRIYIVANLADIKKCWNRGSCDATGIASCEQNYTFCPDDEALIYNTNVVFDRQGTLIARYHKRHLFFELDMNHPVNPKDIYFETDFGTFTTFICFDMVFKESVEAVEKSGVVNVAYPTYWYDTSPFIYLATAYQQAWAMRNKVNLLAANAHQPSSGTLGSGIYSADHGALIHTHNPDWKSKILISNVPKFIESKSPENLNTKRFSIEKDSVVEIKDEEDMDVDIKKTSCTVGVLGPVKTNVIEYNCAQMDSSMYEYTKLEDTEDSLKSCMNDFCCELSYKTNSMDESYYLGVFAGDYTSIHTFSLGTEACILARCDSVNDVACSNYAIKSTTVFKYVNIQGSFTSKHVYPTAVDSNMRLTDKKQWYFNGKSQIIYYNLNQDSALIFLGLYGRDYSRDKIPVMNY